MVSPNRKKHNTIKGVLLIAIFMMALFPFIFISETDVFISDHKIEDRPAKKLNKLVVVEKPLHDVQLPDFIAIKDIPTRKQQFFNFLKPAIDHENSKLAKRRAKVIAISAAITSQQTLTKKQLKFLTKYAEKYKLKNTSSSVAIVEQLLLRIDQIPRELVLVQAANESAWGSSRFARIGLNFFGMWCFKKNCGLVPKGRDSGLNHEVAAFDDLEQMVNHYFHNINTNQAYDLFRTIRGQLRDHGIELRPDVLATGLLPYSERGMDYIVEINTMLRHNHKYIKA
ncbi:glucosaminidase domain-containing protein [Thalassotalea psychrophila]|uniref:Glucosaminidase domain-containing protein n=1 Tax=Thalassotalea psychrophila TaxID=3065647 RepID=A0ABY9U0Q7_9GAMM|nr:glucosaminidase domain-containing protein [Colwelliaceae bacterium SQ149]